MNNLNLIDLSHPILRNSNLNSFYRFCGYSDSLGHDNESTVTAADGASVSQPTSGYQPAWLGGPGQKSMADIVKMGKPQNSSYYNTSNPSQQSINHNTVPEKDPEYDHVSPDNDWPSVDQPQAESGLISGQSNFSTDRTNEYTGYETNDVEVQDENSSEDQIENHVDPGPASMAEPLYDAYEHNDGTKFCCYFVLFGQLLKRFLLISGT